MRIAQVSPLYESVPPKLYGGTERVVAYLTEALIDAGHDVTLFASGDSETRARLYPACPRALRLGGRLDAALAWHYLELQAVLDQAERFDIVHFHTDYLHFPIAPLLRAPHVLTLHGRLDLPELVPLYDRYGDIPLVSISDAQRRGLPRAHWLRTVHHGLPRSTYRLGPGRGGYLAFLGRLSREKRADRAIEIARRAGIPLQIAAKIDPADEDYFAREIRHLLDQPGIEFVGEIDEHEKSRFLGDALALLFPIDWPEPFGLALIEAMACGTPVVAFGQGSVPELVEPGVTGYVVQNVSQAVDAVRLCAQLPRERCRREFERRFTAERMAHDYESVYEGLVEAWTGWPPLEASERRAPDLAARRSA